MKTLVERLEALAVRVESLCTEWGDGDAREERDAIAQELRALRATGEGECIDDLRLALGEIAVRVMDDPNMVATCRRIDGLLAAAPPPPLRDAGAVDAEPVAKIVAFGSGEDSATYVTILRELPNGTLLYTRPAPAQAEPPRDAWALALKAASADKQASRLAERTAHPAPAEPYALASEKARDFADVMQRGQTATYRRTVVTGKPVPDFIDPSPAEPQEAGVVGYIEAYTDAYGRNCRGLVWADHPHDTPGRKFTPLYTHPAPAQVDEGAVERALDALDAACMNDDGRRVSWVGYTRDDRLRAMRTALAAAAKEVDRG